MDTINMKEINLFHILLFFCISHIISIEDDVTKHPGHLNPFGFTGENDKIDVLSQFPTTLDFFTNYVSKSKPLKLAGVVKDSKPHKTWSDEYFLAMEISEVNAEVNVATIHPEEKSPSATGLKQMHFHEFIKQYQESGLVMMGTLPNFLSKDVALPDPLNCKEIDDKQCLEMFDIQFNSGSTSSFVHFDKTEKLICVYQGEKEIVLVDPQKYRHKVDIDRPEGSYSDIDVNKVDYTKYPDLVDVEYYKVSLKSGDCIYVPYKWIQQMRTHKRHIAITTWWNYELCKNLEVGKCSQDTLEPVTLDQVEVHYTQKSRKSVKELKDYVQELTMMRCVTNEKLRRKLLIFLITVNDTQCEEMLEMDEQNLNYLTQATEVFDVDSDEKVCKDELELMPTEGWYVVHDFLSALQQIFLMPEEGTDYYDYEYIDHDEL